MTTFSKTPLLDTIRTPDDLRKLKIEQVQQVADELRLETIDAVSVTGGHFGAGQKNPDFSTTAAGGWFHFAHIGGAFGR